MSLRNETIPNNELFQTIYQFAKEHNKIALLELIKQGHGLNVFYMNVTPIMQLANEGLDDAVNLLLEFRVSTAHAIRGYAMAGNIKKVNTLLKNGASSQEAALGYMIGNHQEAALDLLDKGASISRAALGCSMHGDQQMTQNLLNQGAFLNESLGYARGGHDQYLDHKTHVNDMHEIPGILYGYAMRRDIEKVLFWLATIKKYNYYKDTYQYGLHEATRGLAIQGFTKSFIEELLQQKVNLIQLLIGYIEGGYTKEADSLLEQIKTLSQTSNTDVTQEINQSESVASYQACLDEAVHITAYLGDTARVNSLIADGASLQQAIKGYAYGRHEHHVELLLKHASDISYFNSAAKGYAEGEYFNLLEKTLLRGADAKQACISAFHFTNKNYMLRMLAFIDDAECRKILFEASKEHSILELPFMITFINAEYDALRPMLLQAEKINTMMRESGCGYSEALRLTKSNVDQANEKTSASNKNEEDNPSPLQANNLFAINAVSQQRVLNDHPSENNVLSKKH